MVVRSTLYDVAPNILGSFDKNLAEYATAKFDRAGINIKGSRHVTKVGEGYLEIKEEGKVPFGLLVWNTGLAPNPLIESITELQKDEKTHSLRISDHFRTYTKDGKEMKDVYCIGDASALEEKLPATAQGTPTGRKVVMRWPDTGALSCSCCARSAVACQNSQFGGAGTSRPGLVRFPQSRRK